MLRARGEMKEPLRGPEAIADDVMRSAQLAVTLEVSGWPKPGNVHRTADFEDTTFEQFVAGSIALGPQIRRAAIRGVEAGRGRIELEKVGVEKIIRKMLQDIRSWHYGGNTQLGTSLLLVPLSISAGYTFAQTSELEIPDIRRNAAKVMRATTIQDALHLQEVIELLAPAGLGKLGDKKLPDLSERDARKVIVKKGYTLYGMMKASSAWDNIAREWATCMEISFCHGFPTWLRISKETGEINAATVHTFLSILSKYPDTFIARKIGTRIGGI
jgi:triphosphoribosyl-dephospho-CoA synthase